MRIIFVFCCPFKVLLCSKNQIRLLCQTPKLFYCKTRVVRMGVGKFFLGGTKNVKFVFPSRNEENNLFS